MTISQLDEDHAGTGRGLGFLMNLGEFRFKLWLDSNTKRVLSEIGVCEGMQVLDYGCGSGRYTVPAAKLTGVNGTVYAQDIDKSALQRLRKAAESEGLRNITPIYWDGGPEIPLDDCFLDCVLLIDVIQEVPDWGRLLEDALRVLKHGGILVIYPMHVDVAEVVEAASLSGFRYRGKAVKKRFLLFTKA
ncbi:TPA: class I SAM-dependent methyltransferase [Candidatus Bathyarchaeota archaeon]|nr:class I SAM-dependent methyltransferase [Candidatus Bathyarchaeota archaeon]